MGTIVHASDLHLDSAVQSLAGGPEIRTAIRRAVTRLVELVLREHADLLVISGDVFDRTANSTDAGQFLAGQLSQLSQAGIPVLVAAGNHDVRCPQASAALAGSAASVRWFGTDAPDTYVFDDLGVAVHGQGLADPTEPADLAAAFPAPVPGLLNLGVLHTSLDGRASRTACAPTSTARLAATGYDYWALGHVHRRRVLGCQPWVVYPGILQGRGPHEPGPGGATVITTAGGAVTGLAHHDLAVLRWEPVRVDAAGTLEETLAQVWHRLTPATGIPADGRPVLVDLTLTGPARFPVPSLGQVRAVVRDRPDLLVHSCRRIASSGKLLGQHRPDSAISPSSR